MEKLNKKPKYFLTHKVFLITLLILVLPLFIYNIILYRQEYKLKINDTFTFLEMLTENKKNIIDEKLKVFDYLYNLSNQNVNFENKEICNEKIIDPNLFFKDLAKDFNINQIFYLLFENSLKVKYSSDEKLIGSDFTTSRKILNNKNDLFSLNNKIQKNELYYSKTIYKDKKPIGALVFSFNLDPIYSNLNKYPYSVNLSIIDFSSRIVVTNRKNNNYLYLKPDYEKGLFERGEQNFAIKKQIDDLNYELVLEIPQKELIKKHIQNYLIKYLFVFILVLFFAVFLVYILVFLFSRPIKSLINVMKEITNNKIYIRYKKKLFGFEINYVGKVFNNMMDSLFQKEKEIKIEKIEKQKYIDELEIARDIQKKLFPDKLPLSKDLFIDAQFLPAKNVSADFYDVFKIDDKIFFVLADACGKGVGACLYSLTIRSMIRAFSKSEKKLEDIIKNVNDLFLKDTSNTITFVTAFIGMYDLNKNSFTYTNAGHLPAIFIKNKKLLTLQTKPSRAFGIDKIVDVATKTIKLNKDDLIFIYSDGIIDAKNDKDEIFSNKKLEEFLMNYDIDKSNHLLKDLFSKVNTFIDKSEIIDDMTAILIKKM